MTRVALYARYSSDNQRDASIEDQFRLCRTYAERQSWRIVESYTDRAVSGASLMRVGIQALMSDAQRGRFDVVLAEALDRISRDQEDVAGVFKRLRFAGVKIVALAEGDICELHVGLKGTMNVLFPQRPCRQDPSRHSGTGGEGQIQRRQLLRLPRRQAA